MRGSKLFGPNAVCKGIISRVGQSWIKPRLREGCLDRRSSQRVAVTLPTGPPTHQNRVFVLHMCVHAADRWSQLLPKKKAVILVRVGASCGIGVWLRSMEYTGIVLYFLWILPLSILEPIFLSRLASFDIFKHSSLS